MEEVEDEEEEILPCSAHERTEESESFRCGWRRPSGLCLESLESLDMALAAGRGEEWRRAKRGSHEGRNHPESALGE